VRVANLTSLIDSLTEILTGILMQDFISLSLSFSEGSVEIEDIPEESDEQNSKKVTGNIKITRI
jgi:hypothetical protein